MAINAELFDGTILEFPDGTDPSVIQATAKRMTLERQMAGGEMPRNELGEVVEKDPKGSKAYQAIQSLVDPIRPYVEPVTDYVGEQASLVAGAGLKGVANLQTSIAQSQVAGMMELQEARKAKYGTFENMPPEEQKNYLKAQKYIEGKLSDVAKLGVEKKDIEKKYGVRESTKALDALSESPEYKDASFIGKMGMIGSKIGDDPIGIITDLGIESIPQSYAIASAAIATRFGMLNPKIAAGVGGASSGMMQFGNEYAALREQGMDHVEAWEKAGVKSGIVGLFDAASFYSAGKAAGAVVDNIKKGAVKETVKTVAKETGKQATLGAAGEGVGSAVIGQEVDPLELTKEAIGEVFGAPGDAISTYQGKVAEARAAGKPDPAPPADVAKMMSDKGFTFKKRDEFAGAPQVDITGVGQVPAEETAAAPEQQLIDDIEASQDRQAMLAELEDERDLDRQLKQVSVQEPVVEEVPVEEKAPEFAKAVNVKDFNPEDKAAIRSMEVERNKIGREKKLFPAFLRRQGIQPSEKADLGLEGIRRADIFKKAAPTFDELTSRAISEGFLLSTGDDVQDVENFRQFVSDYIGSGIIGTGPDVARDGQLRAIDDAIQEIVRKYEQPAPIELTGQTPDEARAEAEALEMQRAEEQRVASEQQRAEQEARDRAEIARRSEGAAEDFQLGQTAEENLTGQKDIFAEKPRDFGKEAYPFVETKAPKVEGVDVANVPLGDFQNGIIMGLNGENINSNLISDDAITLLKANELISVDGSGKVSLLPKGKSLSNAMYQARDLSVEGRKELFAKFIPQIAVETKAKPTEEDPDADIPFAKATMEQKNAADMVAKEEGGKVVWQDGDFSLIETTNGTGKVIYKGANKTVYPRFQIDIADFKGDWIPADKLKAMRTAADKLRKEADKKAQKPFIKFTDGVAFSENVEKNVANVARQWKKLLNINNNVYITTFDDVSNNFDKFTGSEIGIRKTLINKGKIDGIMQSLGNGDYVVAFKPNTSKTRMLEVLAHELGHVHEKLVFDSAPAETKAAIKEEYNKWVESQKGKTARELLNSLRALQLSKSVKIRDEKMMATSVEGYWTTFAEWYADQVSRWATTSDKPLSVVDQFFKKIADTLRKFYTSIKGKGYLPNETFKKYLDDAAVNLNLVPEVADVGEQLSLFAESEMKEAESASPDLLFNIERRSAEPPAYAEKVERRPSLRVGMKRLMSQFNAGKIAPETLANRVEFELEFTKDKRKPQPRERGAFYVKERLNKAARKGELSAEAVQLAEWFISKNPALLDDLGISIVTPAEDEVASGFYKPSTRIMTLITHSSNDETAVHEILHHLERMLPDNLQEGIRKSWFTSLAKAAKAADKGADKDLKRFYESLLKYHVEGDRKAMKVAEKLLEDGTVDYEHYQHINPSEFWAVNAADIVAGRYAQSKSTAGKLKQWLKELYQKIKSLFRLQSSAPILRALDSLAKADGRFVNDVMIGEATQYLNRKNYKGGQAPLSAWQDPQESKIDNWLYKIQDKLIDTKRVQQAITQQVGEIEDNWNAYMKEELYHGRTAKRTQDFLKDELAPIVKELAKAGIEIIEFDQFLHNRHAEERNVQIAKINPNMPDSGSGIATADAQQYMKDLDPAKRKLLEKLANKIDDMVKGTQKILIDSGLEEKSTVDAWNGAYKHYVPLKREDVDFVHTGTGLGQGFATRGGTSARATGSLKNVAEIFANLALQRERAIIRSEKARVGRALYGLAIKNPNPDFWLAVNPDAIKNKAKLEQELVSMGLDPLDAKNLIQEPKQQYIDPRTGLVAYRVNPVLRTSDNVFPIRINGQDRFIFFNSSDERAMRMVSALKNLDADQLGLLMNNVANITRWIASVNTQYNPVFGAINFLRDVQGAALNLSTTPLAGKQKEIVKNTFPALKGIYSDLRGDGKGGMWADLWEDYQEAGGQTGYRDQFSRNRKQVSVVEREMGAMKRGRVKRAAYSVAQWLSDYNDSMENAVRLSAYKSALDMGLSKDKAASIAKNLTVNFNRKGANAQTVGALYAFFNASVQGTTRLVETMRGPAGRKIFYGGVALGTLQAVALAVAGFDDDEPPEFIKSRNLIIPTGGKSYIAIPMPLGFNLFPNIGRLTTEFVISGGKKPVDKTLDLVSTVFNTFNPIGGSGLQLVAPTIVDPVAALYTNVDAFGRPISKEDRKTAPTPGYSRSREQASTVNKYIAEFLNYASGGTKYQKGAISPTADQLDYLVGQATGGVGRETMKAVGAVKALATGEELPSYKVPLAGKFYGNTESPANIASKFYDNVTQLANYENEIKGRQKNRENVGAFLREHPEARLYQRANQLENQITQLNRDKKELQERKAPQKQIDVLDKRKTMLMDKFNKDYKKASK